MPTRKIDKLIWMALTDSAFRKRLINGRRREVLSMLDMTEAERESIRFPTGTNLNSPE